MWHHLRPPRHAILLGTGLVALAAATIPMSVGAAMAHTKAAGTSGMQMARSPASGAELAILKHGHIAHVNIQNLAFAPHRIVVSPGTKIIWTNKDGFQHTVTSDNGVWDSGPINAASTFPRVFKKTGTFTYHCTIHPFMHGTITVRK